VKSIKTRIAAGATILGLAGLAGVALNAGNQGASQLVATKPLVRTKVIRRTVHVTKHAKPKRPVAVDPPAAVASSPAPPVTTSTSGAPEEPVITSSSGASEAPVTTAASGAGGGEVEHEPEHEGGDD
jgi:hypothetical protein